MRFSNGIRLTHRWLSIVFTLTVLANFVAMIWGPPPAWITYSPLPFLFAQLVTGLWMFFRPYFTRRAAGAA